MIANIQNSKRFGGAIYSAEYQAVLDYADANSITTPSNAQNDINDAIIVNFKTESIWGEFDLFYYFKQESGMDEFATLNWDDPSKFRLTGSNKPTFEADEGYLAENGSGHYFETNFIPLTDSVNNSKTSSAVIFKIYDSGVAFGSLDVFMGRNPSGDTGQMFVRINSTTLILARVNGFDSNLTYSNDPEKHRHFADIGSVSNRYKDGVLEASQTNYTLGVLSGVQPLLFGFNNSGVFSGSAGDIGMEYFALGSDLNSKQLEVYEILNGLY